MVDGFYNTGKETICQYILDNYIFDEDRGANLSDVIRQRAQGIINLRVGNTPPNFPIADPNGKMVELSDITSSHKYTLVMFWASWCHKCEQEIPNPGRCIRKEPPRLRHGGHFRGPAEDGVDQGDRRQPDRGKTSVSCRGGMRRSPICGSRRRRRISCLTRRAT